MYAQLESAATAPIAPRASFRVFLWLSMLFFLGALTHLLGTSAAVAGPLASLYQPVAVMFYIGAALVLASTPFNRRLLKGYLLNNAWLTASLVLIAASALWSIEPAATIRRSAAVFGTTIAGISVGLVYARYDYVGFIRRVFFVFVGLSFLVAILLPEYGVHYGSAEHEGRWRGLLSFKNQMAWMAALFILVWASRMRLGSWLRLSQTVPLAIGLITLIKCGSATGILQAAFGLCVLLILRFYFEQRRARALIVLGAVLLLAASAAVGQALFGMYLEATERTATLSGRTVIWSDVWPYIKDRPLLGYGQSAFWHDPTRFFGNSYWVGAINHAHNAYIEVLLDLGLVGLTLQMLFFGALLRSLWVRGRSGDRDASGLLALLAAIALAGMAGPMFFRPNGGIWALMASISAYAYAKNRLELWSTLAQGKIHREGTADGA